MSVSGLSLTHPSAHPNVLPLLFWVFSLSSHLENGNVFPAEDAVSRNSKLLLLGALEWCWVLGVGFWTEVGRRDLLPSSGFQVVTHPLLIKPEDSQSPLDSFIGSFMGSLVCPEDLEWGQCMSLHPSFLSISASPLVKTSLCSWLKIIWMETDAGRVVLRKEGCLDQQQLVQDAVLIAKHVLFLEITKWNHPVHIT